MEQCITCSVSYGIQKFFFNVVYGCNEGIDRRQLWSHLVCLKGPIARNPWMLAEDFNVILHPSEGSNYKDIPTLTLNSREFVDCVQELTVFDHAYNGPFLTWSNRQREFFFGKKAG